MYTKFIFFVIFVALNWGILSETSAQTVSDHAVIHTANFTLNAQRRSKKFTFKAPSGFVKGTNLAKPILNLNMGISASSSKPSASVKVLVNGKVAYRTLNYYKSRVESNAKRTRSIMLDGALFKPNATNTIEIQFSGGTSMTVDRVMLFYQIKLPYDIKPVP